MGSSTREDQNPGQNPAQMAAMLALTLVIIGGMLVFAFRAFVRYSEQPAPEDLWKQGALASALLAVVIVGMLSAVVSVLLVKKYGREGVTSRAAIALGLGLAVFVGIVVMNVVAGGAAASSGASGTELRTTPRDPAEDKAAQLKKLFKGHGEVVSAFEKAGGMNMETLGTDAEIEKRLGLLKKIEESDAEIDLLYADGESETPATAADPATPADPIKRLRDLDHQYADTAGEILTLLHEKWGKWKFDVEAHLVKFEGDDESGVAYNTAAAQLKKVLDERAALKSELIEQQKQNKK